MLRHLQYFLLLFFLISCNKNSYNGQYCAHVEYHNPKTGTVSDYNLTIEVSDNRLTKLNFPNGGYLDDELGKADISDGDADVSFKNKEYHIEIIGKGNDCLNKVPPVKQCNGTTKKGRRCKNVTDNENGFCNKHQNQSE